MECSPWRRCARVASAWMALSVRSDRTRYVEDVTSGSPFAHFGTVGPGGPVGRRSQRRPFFRVSGGRDLRLGFPDVVVALPVADVSRLHAQAPGDGADEGDADRLPGDGVPDGALVAPADQAGELSHGVAALIPDQAEDLGAIRLAHRS